MRGCPNCRTGPAAHPRGADHLGRTWCIGPLVAKQNKASPPGGQADPCGGRGRGEEEEEEGLDQEETPPPESLRSVKKCWSVHLPEKPGQVLDTGDCGPGEGGPQCVTRGSNTLPSYVQQEMGPKDRKDAGRGHAACLGTTPVAGTLGCKSRWQSSRAHSPCQCPAEWHRSDEGCGELGPSLLFLSCGNVGPKWQDIRTFHEKSDSGLLWETFQCVMLATNSKFIKPLCGPEKVTCAN